jgi:hypothetical protein
MVAASTCLKAGVEPMVVAASTGLEAEAATTVAIQCLHHRERIIIMV